MYPFNLSAGSESKQSEISNFEKLTQHAAASKNPAPPKWEKAELDSETFEFLKKELGEGGEVIALLNHKPGFLNQQNYEAKNQVIRDALISQGATYVRDDAVKFSGWTPMVTAKDKIRYLLRWAFYHPDEEFAQLVRVEQEPTINTIVAAYFPEKEESYQISSFQFFEF